MILYLVKSTLCLVLLLLVYHLFLEKEKMHHFNRIFLLLSLIFSLAIPLIPAGGGGSFLPWSESGQALSAGAIHPGSESTVASQSETNGHYISGFLLYGGIMLYSLVMVLLFIRFIVRIDSIFLKVKRHNHILYEKADVVLLKEETIPYSFLNYIFLSERDYRDGKITEEVLIHEFTHIRQKHTLDILFVEVLKILFWFNPIFHYYKKAIQLNHEFLADQAVVSGTGRMSEYQSLLLQAMQSHPGLVLSSNFTISMTKKRLLMMTQKASRIRTLFKKITILPILVGAALLFGCHTTDAEIKPEDQIITIEIVDSEIIKLNGKEIHYSLLGNQLEGIPDISESIIEMKVLRNALRDVIMGVQRILREKGSLKINYSTTGTTPLSRQEINRNELKRIINEYARLANRYMQMNAQDFSSEELKKTYDEVMEWYHAIDEKQKEVYRDISAEAPPLPPLPPNPEWRLENEVY